MLPRSPGTSRDKHDDTPTAMFRQNLAQAHLNLIRGCATPIVDEAFLNRLDRALEAILHKCSGSFENLSNKTLNLVDSTFTAFVSKVQGLSDEQCMILCGYARGYIGHRLDSRTGEVAYADDGFDD